MSVDAGGSEKCRVIDGTGNIVIEPEYSFIIDTLKIILYGYEAVPRFFICYKTDNNSSALFDENGKEIIAFDNANIIGVYKGKIYVSSSPLAVYGAVYDGAAEILVYDFMGNHIDNVKGFGEYGPDSTKFIFSRTGAVSAFQTTRQAGKSIVWNMLKKVTPTVFI